MNPLITRFTFSAVPIDDDGASSEGIVLLGVIITIYARLERMEGYLQGSKEKVV